MSDAQPSPLSDLLAYLGEIGYGDLYLRPAAVLQRQPEPEPEAAMPPVQVIPAMPTMPTVPTTSPAAVAPQETGGDAASRLTELMALAASAEGCTRCRLSEGRHKVVFGSGNPDADLLLIGEGPGAEEDRQGLPFVGAAGDLLTRIIQAIEMSRDEVYIANIVKCRPPGNRDPQPDEVAACRGYLERQIALVRPKVIVALGKVAAQTLLGTESPIGQMRGRWYRVHGIPTMVTYHPAALLRNPALKRPTWEDLQQVRDRLRAG